MSTATATVSTAPDAANPDVSRPNKRPIVIPLDEAGLALRMAWVTYIGLALIPPAAMIASIFFLIFTGNDRVIQNTAGAGSTWPGIIFLIGGLTFVGVALPLAFYARRKLWINYYEGGVVPPGNYLRGWMAVWIPLVIGGVLGFIGLALTREVGNLFTSLLAFMVFLSMTPNGHALVRPVGDQDDPGTYEEPK